MSSSPVDRWRAEATCERISRRVSSGSVTAAAAGTSNETMRVLADAKILIACGAAGVELVDEATIGQCRSLGVAIDLNAVPPTGIGGIAITDKAKELAGAVVYGAIGVGGLKMKTHRRAIELLFESNDKTLDAEQIYDIAKSIG